MTWRELTATDAPAWSELIDAVAVADDTGEHFPPDALVEELAEPGAESLAAFDGAELVAAGQVMPIKETYEGDVRAFFIGAVHPEARGRGIGAELFDRLEAMAADAARRAFPGREFQLKTQAFDGAASAIALIESKGYAAVRWFHQMEAVEAMPTVHDRGLQRYRPELDDAVREAHLAAFAGHWGSAPPSEETWRTHYTGSSTFRPQFSTVATTGARVDGYVLSAQFEPDCIEISTVGVRPEARGRGLGRALLEATLAEIAAAGVPRAMLYVDSQNAQGAGRLYESVGFLRRRSVVQYQRLSDAW